MERDYTKCDVCGATLGPDRLHILIDNGRVARHTYACRKHRYVLVDLMPRTDLRPVQERTDLEIEMLAFAFRRGDLKPGWE